MLWLDSGILFVLSFLGSETILLDLHCSRSVVYYMSLVMRNPFFAYAKTKKQFSFAVTAKLISACVFATRIVQSLYFLNPKYQASGHLLWLYRLVCVGPGGKPRRPVFSQRGSYENMCRSEEQTRCILD